MNTKIVMAWRALFVLIAVMVVAVAFPSPGLTQDKPADNMQILRDKINPADRVALAVAA